VSDPEVILADLTWVNRFSAVIPATAVTGDSVVVTTRITARLTGHAVVRANLDLTRNTGPEMIGTNRVCALSTGAGMSVTVKVTIDTASVEL
jgi:hypothetical protein